MPNQTYKERCSEIIVKCVREKLFTLASAIQECYDSCETEADYKLLWSQIIKIGED